MSQASKRRITLALTLAAIGLIGLLPVDVEARRGFPHFVQSEISVGENLARIGGAIFGSPERGVASAGSVTSPECGWWDWLVSGCSSDPVELVPSAAVSETGAPAVSRAVGGAAPSAARPGDYYVTENVIERVVVRDETESSGARALLERLGVLEAQVARFDGRIDAINGYSPRSTRRSRAAEREDTSASIAAAVSGGSSDASFGTLSVSGAATSTFGNGLDIADGCFAIDGVCLDLGDAADGTFSTTSAAYWESTQARWATTSSDYWESTQARWATTSSDYWESTQARWATTSSDYWESTQARWATTSSDYWESTQARWATTSSAYWLTTKTTADLAESGSLYYTDARVAAYVSASSTIPHIGGSAYGDVLYWTGTAWSQMATSTLGIDGSKWDDATGGINYSGGNVAIGNSAPSELLTLGSATETSGNRKALRFNAGGYAAPGVFNTNSNGDKIIFYQGSDFDGRFGASSGGEIWLKALSTNTSNTGFGSLSFYTGQGVTPSPNLRMHLGATGGVALGGTITSATNYTGATLVLSTGGNVGIGASSPVTGLEVANNGVNISGNFNYNMYVHNAGGNKGFAFGYDTSSQTGIIAPSGGTADLAFWTPNSSVWSEKIRFTAAGNVGIGSTTPTNKLVVQATNGDVSIGTFQSSYPGIAINNTNAGSSYGGFMRWQKNGTNQWGYGMDYVGNGGQDFWLYNYASSKDALYFSSANGYTTVAGHSNAASPLAVNGGAAIGAGYVTTAAPSNGLLVQGSVGVGTSTPWKAFSVTGAVAFDGLSSMGASDQYVCINPTTKEVTFGAVCTASSERFKHDIEVLGDSDGLALVRQLRPVSFAYNETGQTRLGFIAEDIDRIDPRLVFYESDGTTPKGVLYQDFTPILAKSVQELDVRIEGLAEMEPWSGDAEPDSFAARVVARIAAWLGDAGNGLAAVFAGKVQTNELCLAGANGSTTCITRDQLEELLGTDVPLPVPGNGPDDGPAPSAAELHGAVGETAADFEAGGAGAPTADGSDGVPVDVAAVGESADGAPDSPTAEGGENSDEPTGDTSDVSAPSESSSENSGAHSSGESSESLSESSGGGDSSDVASGE